MSMTHRTTLSDEAQALLDATFARNRALYAGFRMELDGETNQEGQESDETAPPSDSQESTEASGQSDDSASQNGSDGSNGTDDQNGSDDLSALDQATLARMIRDLRKENASQRTRRTEAEKQADAQVQDAIKAAAVAAGLIKADEPEAKAPSVDELTRGLTDAQSALREAKAEATVLRVGAKTGANVDALMDRVSFTKTLNALDPTTADYAAKVQEAITAALEADPSLKTAPAAGTGGPDLDSGSSAPSGTTTKQEIEALVRARTKSRRH